MATNRKYLNESLLHVVPSEAIVKVKPTDMSIVTCSPYDQLAEFEKHVPTLDVLKSWTANQVHKALGDAFVGTTVNYLAAQNLIADAKRRMQKGEAVGGCKTWTSYVDTYIRKPHESLPVVIRKLYRKLDGECANPKYNGTAKRKKKPTLFGKNNRQLVEEGIARTEDARGLTDGKRMATETVTPNDAETLTETSFIHIPSDGKPSLKSLRKRWDTFENALSNMKSVARENPHILYKVEATYVLTVGKS
jgi:hypothetical protein